MCEYSAKKSKILIRIMWFTKWDCYLVLSFFLLNSVNGETEETENWWGTLRNGVYNIFSGNWGSDVSTTQPVEFLKSDFIKNEERNPNSGFDEHESPIILDDVKNEEEKPKAIPFSDFAKNLKSMISPHVNRGRETIKSIYETIQEAILNNKLETNIMIGSKKILVGLGMLGSDERTKNMEEIQNFFMLCLEWLKQMFQSVLSYIPGMPRSSQPIHSHLVEPHSSQTTTGEILDFDDEENKKLLAGFYAGLAELEKEIMAANELDPNTKAVIENFRRKYREMDRKMKQIKDPLTRNPEITAEKLEIKTLMLETLKSLKAVVDNPVIIKHVPNKSMEDLKDEVDVALDQEKLSVTGSEKMARKV